MYSKRISNRSLRYGLGFLTEDMLDCENFSIEKFAKTFFTEVYHARGGYSSVEKILNDNDPDKTIIVWPVKTFSLFSARTEKLFRLAGVTKAADAIAVMMSHCFAESTAIIKSETAEISAISCYCPENFKSSVLEDGILAEVREKKVRHFDHRITREAIFDDTEGRYLVISADILTSTANLKKAFAKSQEKYNLSTTDTMRMFNVFLDFKTKCPIEKYLLIEKDVVFCINPVKIVYTQDMTEKYFSRLFDVVGIFEDKCSLIEYVVDMYSIIFGKEYTFAKFKFADVAKETFRNQVIYTFDHSTYNNFKDAMNNIYHISDEKELSLLLKRLAFTDTVINNVKNGGSSKIFNMKPTLEDMKQCAIFCEDSFNIHPDNTVAFINNIIGLLGIKDIFEDALNEYADFIKNSFMVSYNKKCAAFKDLTDGTTVIADTVFRNKFMQCLFESLYDFSSPIISNKEKYFLTEIKPLSILNLVITRNFLVMNGMNSDCVEEKLNKFMTRLAGTELAKILLQNMQDEKMADALKMFA